ncbi:hypothetical protein LCC91_08190 [Tepidimonas taiwanensis]|uniref:Uncharacterized protein n=1 Tax=Tepidimonas taiwanensis TaxID=307486 RepID=A0A554XAQ3_9BURK|nr:hypothetical protein [Tepidimonas taiwanensis]TSE32912.1 hypothetical protein Ttaiw_00772 [Tepidimonas taiwanensis]UBQ04552.1 hypothetical protein LCC91_08190 [Tepidimonas taiwanensis]
MTQGPAGVAAAALAAAAMEGRPARRVALSGSRGVSDAAGPTEALA